MKYLYLIIAVVLVSGLAISFYYLPRKMVISDIECVDQFGKCDEALASSLKAGVGTNLLDSRKNVLGVLGFNTLISDYSVEYKFPDVLKVNVLRRKPRFALSNDSGLVALVDGTGVVVGYSNETLLSTVNTVDNLAEVGKSVNENELLALKLVAGINSVDSVSRAEIQNEMVAVRMGNGIDVLFPLDGDDELLLGSLVMIMSKLDSDEELRATTKTVDLRFDNPVLR